MARRAAPRHWFVSVRVPRRGRGAPARETKTFATEAEAKQYAKEMLVESNTIYAGTLIGPDQRVRRMISGSKLHHWIEEED
jgi:hypothetical protein